MKEEIKAFFASGKLEQYLMGLCDPEEKKEVEAYIERYPEVRKEYEAMQRDIEAYARSIAERPPSGLKSESMQEIQSSRKEGALSASAPSASRSRLPIFAVLATLMSLALAAWLWTQKRQRTQQLAQLQKRYDTLASNYEKQQTSYTALRAERALLFHPATQTLILEGDAMGTAFYAAAFWNKDQAVGHINLEHLPKPPNAHCFQLWADVNGEMVSLGVLPSAQQRLIALPFMDNATSLNVTIEPEGGSEHPTVSRLIASVPV